VPHIVTTAISHSRGGKQYDLAPGDELPRGAFTKDEVDRLAADGHIVAGSVPVAEQPRDPTPDPGGRAAAEAATGTTPGGEQPDQGEGQGDDPAGLPFKDADTANAGDYVRLAVDSAQASTAPADALDAAAEYDRKANPPEGRKTVQEGLAKAKAKAEQQPQQ